MPSGSAMVAARPKSSSLARRPVASSSQLASQSPARTFQSQPDPLPSDDSDPDFGSSLRANVKLEEEEERRELTGGKGSGGRGKDKGKGRAVAAGRQKGKRWHSTDGEESGDRSEYEDGEVVPTRASNKGGSSSKHTVEDRYGIKFNSKNGDSSEDEYDKVHSEKGKVAKGKGKGKGKNGVIMTEQEVKANHLREGWRYKDDPEKMSLRRMKLERQFCPLIELLDIKIEIIHSDAEDELVNNVTSDEDGIKLATSDDDSEPNHFHGKPEVKPKVDVKPDIFRVKKEVVENELPPGKGHAPVANDIEMLELSSDPEPDTESAPESDSPVDVKPIISLPRTTPVASTSQLPANATIHIDSSDPEPSTEEEQAMEEEEDEEPEDYETKLRMEAHRAAQKKQAQDLMRERARVMRDQVDRKLAEEEAAQRLNGVNSDSFEAEEVMSEEETVQEMARRESKKAKVDLPYKVGAGMRPRFEIQTIKQHSTGAHILEADVQIPATMNRFLRPYQREGVDFFYRQYKNGKGGILGDDMGLGKTIQIIAFLAAVMRKKGTRVPDERARRTAIAEIPKGDPFPDPSSHSPTCLIACPASVVHNWAREFQVWGYFQVAVYEGSLKQRKEVMEQFKNGYIDVVIAGIEAVRNNIDTLALQDFTIVIVDEAHRVKNPKSNTTKALNRFQTPYRYGLTGTAIQNRLGEFWTILDWANPKAVGSRLQWKVYVTKPIQESLKADATDAMLAKGRIRSSALVGRLLPKMFLRRMKDVIKNQLPKKTDLVVLCPLTKCQIEAYKNCLACPEVQIILTHKDPCECGAVDGYGLPYSKGKCCHEGWTQLIFKYMALFIKISNHVALIYPDSNDKHEKKIMDEEFIQIAFPKDYEQRSRLRMVAGSDKSLCGKWKILEELLELWHGQGDKVLIFSISLKVLELVKEFMDDTHYTYRCLDGSVPNDQRMGLVDDFNNKPEVFCFLISTRAGGVGLNLTAANKVVVFDPSWNPANDLQAMDRAYRFGQLRDVEVYRFMASGTIEELIYNRQQYKRATASIGYEANAERRMYQGVEGVKDDQGELWGVNNLFKLSQGLSLTAKSIRDVGLAELDFAMNNDLGVKSKAGSKLKSKGKKLKGSDSDSPALPNSDDDTGLNALLGLDEGEEKVLSEKEVELARKRAEEQAKINDIFKTSGVTLSVNSDATLGSSAMEVALARRAIHAVSQKPLSNGTARKGLILPGPNPSQAAPTSIPWDPSTRYTSSTPRPTTPYIRQSHRHALKSFQTLALSLGISPDVSLEDLIAPAGYLGIGGMGRLGKELDELGEGAGGRGGQVVGVYKMATSGTR